jgi:hypothetical protein
VKLHSDKITTQTLTAAIGTAGLRGVAVEAVTVGSRKRARGIEFRLDAAPGPGRRRRNSGQYGAESGYAATWDEHGAWFAVLFDIDPEAIIGSYDGREDFERQTGGKYRAAVSA